MKLLRMSEGSTLIYSETIRYFSLPKSYPRLLKIFERCGYQSNTDMLSLLDTSSFNPLSGEYKTTQSNENERMGFTFEQLALNPLNEILNCGIQLILNTKTNPNGANFLWFVVVDFNDTYELFTHNYASMLSEIPMTEETKFERLHLQREYEREIKLLQEYRKAL
jgi:hypothetical protein